jgi:hypothetical protein
MRNLRLLLSVAALAAALVAPARAETITPAQLAGWWLSIDSTLPDLWAGGHAFPVEELLVLDANGKAETRYLSFVPPSAEGCSFSHKCSDAPLTLTTAYTIAGDLITFAPPSPTPAKERETHVRSSGLDSTATTSTPVWHATFSGVGKVLIFDQVDNSAPRRVFAHVDRARLGRLRAGFFPTQASVVGFWRCYLAHATVGDPAFLPIFHGEAPPPAWFEAYLDAASYALSLEVAASRPPPDYPNPKVAETAKAPLEPLLTATFPDTGFAQVMDVWHGLDLRWRYLRARVLDGLDDEHAQAAVAKDAKGVTVTLPLSEVDIDRLAGAKTNPEMTAMLTCGK